MSRPVNTRISVDKAWGHEDWIVNNPLYCGKRMTLRPGWRCSMHRHLVKHETFFVEQGIMFVEIGDEKRMLWPGDSAEIAPGVWHRFTNLNTNNVVFFEFSTHHDDNDVERREPSGPVK